MAAFPPEYLVDKDNRTRAVVIPVEEWHSIVAELEELDEIHAYDRAKAEIQDSIPFEDAVRTLDNDVYCADSAKPVGRKVRRFWLGPFRVMFGLDDSRQLIFVLAFGHRR